MTLYRNASRKRLCFLYKFGYGHEVVEFLKIVSEPFKEYTSAEVLIAG